MAAVATVGHTLVRTSPDDQPYAGMCAACGKDGLTHDVAKAEPCSAGDADNPLEWLKAELKPGETQIIHLHCGDWQVQFYIVDGDNHGFWVDGPYDSSDFYIHPDTTPIAGLWQMNQQHGLPPYLCYQACALWDFLTRGSPEGPSGRFKEVSD